MNTKSALSSNSRKELISKLISAGGVESQSQLVKLLAKQGVKVTQATTSRDLEEIGAIRVRNAFGNLQYQIPENFNKPSSGSRNLILGVEYSGNMAVIRTPSGGAQLLASAIDRNGLDGELRNVIGTIAGDDTVLVISKSSSGGKSLATAISSYAKKGR